MSTGSEQVSASEATELHGRSCALNPSPDGACELRRCVSWRSAVLIAFGTAVLVSVSLGPMAGELGNLSPIVWALTAGVGALQCLLIAELATRFPSRAGGSAVYAEEGLRGVSPLLGAVSSWGYWFAWTPGIAVNLIVAAAYLRAAAWPGANTLVLALAIAAMLYILNYFGLRPTMRLYVLVAVLAAVPLVLLIVGALLRPSLIDFGRMLPLRTPRGGTLASGATWALLLKWTFVAAWTAYGSEMASTITAEVRDPRSAMPRAMGLAGGVGLVSFGLVPLLIIALVGAAGMTQDASVVLLPAAKAVLGGAGSTVLSLTLAAALVLGAHAFVVGSSRTIYQMSRDGHLPHVFAHVNRHGVPTGGILWDGSVILTMLLVFGPNVVNVIAAANVGYLVVFILLPVTYLVVRVRGAGSRAAFELPRGFMAVAAVLAIFNTVLLVGGCIMWGTQVALVGTVVMLMIVPISVLRRRRGAVAVRVSAVTVGSAEEPELAVDASPR
jgi:amino acid transporter